MRQSISTAQTICIALTVALGVVLASACSTDPASQPIGATDPTPTQSQEPGPANTLQVSDAVPTIEELQEMGLSGQAAECFITTIDPNNTGRVESADLFLEAWVACL